MKTSPRRFIPVVLPIVLAVGVALWLTLVHGHRTPPNIFDTPVDDVAAYLASKDFNSLSTEERLEYIQGILKRFNSMSQTDSAVAAAFFAGLSGPASEQLMSNARVLGKDIMVEGARQYLALTTDEEKGKFIDQWLVQWVHFAQGMDLGRRRGTNAPEGAESPASPSDQDILTGLGKQARRDAQRTTEVNAVIAQQVMDFWSRDIASVASPKEQGQIIAFIPAIRNHLIEKGK